MKEWKKRNITSSNCDMVWRIVQLLYVSFICATSVSAHGHLSEKDWEIVSRFGQLILHSRQGVLTHLVLLKQGSCDLPRIKVQSQVSSNSNSWYLYLSNNDVENDGSCRDTSITYTNNNKVRRRKKEKKKEKKTPKTNHHRPE